MGSNTFWVQYAGNAYTDKEMVEACLLYRCAELAYDAGFDYFVIVKGGTETTRDAVSPPSYYQSTYSHGKYSSFFIPSMLITMDKHRASVTMQAFKGKPMINAPATFVAREVLDYLDAKVAKKESHQPTKPEAIIEKAVEDSTPKSELSPPPSSVDIKVINDAINLRDRQGISVAILSASDFSPLTMVDSRSLTFGRKGDERSFMSCNKDSDVNGNLICQFSTWQAKFKCGDTEAILRGKMVTGESFEARNAVLITPCRVTSWSEPEGFKGIKWGTDLSSLSGMQYLRADPGSKDIKIYVREGDELTIGRVNLKGIEYHFRKENFFGVKVLTESFEDFRDVRAAIFEKFGRGSQANRGDVESYLWFDEQTTRSLEYNEVSKKGVLSIYSTTNK